MTRLRAVASATGSPDDTISRLPGPRTRVNPAGSAAFAAAISAATASSAVLKRSWATAPVASMKKANVAATRAYRRNHEQGRELSADGTVIIMSSRTAISVLGRWNPCPRCEPPVVGLELQAELVVEDP